MRRTYYYSDELNDDFAGTKIEAKALKKLRHPSRAKLLKDFRNE